MATMLPSGNAQPQAVELYTAAGSVYLRNIVVISALALVIGVAPKLVRCILDVGWILDLCFAFALAGGYQLALLSLVRGMRPDPRAFVANIKYFWIYFAGDFLFWAMFIAGFLGLLVPSVFLGVRFSLYRCCIADQNCGPLESLKISWQMTKGRFWKLCGAYGMMFGTVLLLGVILTQIGKQLHLPQKICAGFISVFAASLLVILECKVYVWLHGNPELTVSPLPPPENNIEMRPE